VADDLPHGGVWARLGASPHHGVGVFAIIAIPKGTDVFGNDLGDIIWIDAEDAQGATEDEHRRLYHDFAIQRGPLLGCPVNFNQLSVGWYVNEPNVDETANLIIGADFAMIADRDIAQGEELTIIYSTFSR
jgi:hypothetical protein